MSFAFCDHSNGHLWLWTTIGYFYSTEADITLTLHLTKKIMNSNLNCIRGSISKMNLPCFCHNFDIISFRYATRNWANISPTLVLTVAVIPFLIIPVMRSQPKRNLYRYINSTIKWSAQDQKYGFFAAEIHMYTISRCWILRNPIVDAKVFCGLVKFKSIQRFMNTWIRLEIVTALHTRSSESSYDYFADKPGVFFNAR